MSSAAFLYVQELAKRRAGLTAPVSPFARYASDPVGFSREVLGADPWETPEAIMRAIRASGGAEA